MTTSFFTDVRSAVRGLRASPMVSATVVASLALAIGVNTAIFSILDSLLLRPLPIADAACLVQVTDSVTTDTGQPRIRAWSNPVWEQIRDRGLFPRAAAWSAARFDRAAGGQTQFVDGLWVNGGFFDTLGVRLTAGRMLTPLDDLRGGGADGPVAVLSHDYWQRAYGGDAAAIGQRVQLDGVTFTIVGVTAKGFFGLEVGRSFDVAVPLATEALMRGNDSVLADAGSNFLSIVAQLKAGQTVAAAGADLRRAQRAIREATLGPWEPEVAKRYLLSPFTAVALQRGTSVLRRNYEGPVRILATIVGLILLIGCVNVANLLLARAVTRRREVSIQLALGASRARIVRQRLMESVLLAAAGAAIGLGLASVGSRFLVAQLSSPANRVVLDLSLDWRVLAFTTAVSLASALLVGALPAWRATRAEAVDALRSRGVSGGASLRLMDGLVTTQVALSLVLLVGAALFVQSFGGLLTRDLGLSPDAVLVATIDGTAVGDPANRRVAYERLRQDVAHLPAIADAATSFVTPFSGGGFTPAIEIPGEGADSRRVAADRDVFGNLVSPRWFSTLGTRLLSGRDFTDADRAGAVGVAIVNETFVARYLSGATPLGRRIIVYPNTPRALALTVVGVARDAVTSPRDAVAPNWFVPIAQGPALPLVTVRLNVRVRTGPPRAVSREVAAAIAAVDPRLRVTFRPLDDLWRGSLTRDRLMAQVSGVFGALALLLSGLGLYGVTAYAVSARRADLGIRIAMGAAPRRIAGMTLARVARVVGLGIVAGAALAWWSGDLFGSLLYGVSPRNPITLVLAATILLGLALLAGWLPARRAARLDPADVLRLS